jgi:hypothetical protein
MNLFRQLKFPSFNFIILKSKELPGIVVHTPNPSIEAAETEESRVQRQPGLQSKFQANLGYLVTLF